MLEKIDYFKKAIEGNDKNEFANVIGELEAISPKDLDNEFKQYLFQKAIEIFDLTFTKSESGFFNDYNFYLKDERRRNEIYSYQKSVLRLLNYVSIFSEKKYLEEIFKRSITKNLIIFHTEDCVNMIKKFEQELKKTKKFSNSVGFILNLEKEGKIELKKEDLSYLKNLFFSTYKNSSSKEKCSLLLTNLSILKENLGKDEEIIKTIKKCICKERYFGGVILYEISLINEKIRGTDFLIKHYLGKEKNENKNNIQKKLLEIYLRGEKENYPEFFIKFNVKEIEYSPNKYCKSFIFFR